MMYRQNHVHHGRIEKLVSLLLSMEVHLGLRHQIGVASAILEKTSKMDFVGAHGQPGRPVSSREVRDLICKMRRENPSWGARRIHGELFKFGIDVGESCVCKYIRAPEIQST
jgi:hypothetical protein